MGGASPSAAATGPKPGAPSAENGNRWIVVPQSPERVRQAAFRRAQRKRQYTLIALAVLVVAAAVLAVFFGGPLWELQLVSDAGLALYVLFLLEAKKRRSQHAAEESPFERARQRLRRSERPQRGAGKRVEA